MIVAYVVNSDLNMGKGKVAAQVSHGAFGLMKSQPEKLQENLGKAVVIRADSETFESLIEEVWFEKLPHYVVEDAGRTQVSAGSRTVLAIGPASRKRIEPLIKGLKLLGRKGLNTVVV